MSDDPSDVYWEAEDGFGRLFATDDADGTLTWRQLFNETRERIGDAQHAKWICQQASDTNGAEWLQALDAKATNRAVAHLDAMVERRLAGEPLQYVLGSWSFRRLDLMVDRRVLIPRPETEQVVEVALEHARLRAAPRLIADLGTGSGAIALSLALELPRASTTIWATDASADALDVCRANLAGIGLAGRSVRIGSGSWFEALPDELEASFDVIVSNPPYIATGAADVEAAVTWWEPHTALFAGADGLDDIRTIVGGAMAWLAPGGSLALEIGADQGAAVGYLLDAGGFIDVAIGRDLAGLDRIASGRRPS